MRVCRDLHTLALCLQCLCDVLSQGRELTAFRAFQRNVGIYREVKISAFHLSR